MRSKRWGEEIVQTQREMLAFCKYFKNLHTKLTEELHVQQIIVESYEEIAPVSENDVSALSFISTFFSFLNQLFFLQTRIYPEAIQEARARIVLINEEITRVKIMLASATNRFQGHFDYDEDYHDEDGNERECNDDEDEVSPFHCETEIAEDEMQCVD